jgi:uncharacterized protein YigA (DUF484 family)
MQVAALAEALVRSRRPDGAVSLEELQLGLSRAGLEELVRAVGSLSARANSRGPSGPVTEKHPWF